VGLDIGERQIAAELVKEALFADLEVARAVTGFFGVGANSTALKLEVQLRPGRAASADLRNRLETSLERYTPGLPRHLRLFAYGDFPFPITYERKHPYLTR
jgi:hypothetical protein